MLKRLGLGGDGDEVDAIERVEARFGIAFDHKDCERFRTVGDIWRALLTELKATDAEAAQHWPTFVQALGQETLAETEFDQVEPETQLLGGLTVAETLRAAARKIIRR